MSGFGVGAGCFNPRRVSVVELAFALGSPTRLRAALRSQETPLRSLHAFLTMSIVAACATVMPASVSAQATVLAEEWDHVTDDGIRLYVAQLGRGDTVVVLHGGWGGEHSELIEAFRPLADRFHFVFYDQRGSLRSRAPESTLTVSRLVRDLEGLRRQLRVERLTLLGHSMGAVLAYAYLAQHPDRVRGLVLVAPVRPTDDLRVPPGDTARIGALRRALNAAQSTRRAAILAAEKLDRADTSSYTDRERTARWRIGLAALMLAQPERWREHRGGPRYFNPAVGQAIERNSTRAERDSMWRSFLPALERHRGPVVAIVGEEDFVDPQAALWRYVAARLPRVRLEVLPGAGHLPWIDRPEQFRTLLSDALGAAGGR